MTRPLVGLDMFYYAIMDLATETYNTPVAVANAVSMSISPNSDIATFFADDGPREVHSQIGEVDVSIQVADLPPADYAALIGADYAAGIIDFDVEATAPEVAIGFRAKKSNGAYRYMWLSKGKFGIPNMEHQTQEGTVNFQPQTINGKFVARERDDLVFRRIDSDDVLVAVDLPGAWFTDPDVVTALAAITMVSVLPADSATAVAVDATVTWTFDNAVLALDINTDNFKLYNATTGAWVAASVAAGAATEVVLTPSANLDAATSRYIAFAYAGIRGVAHSGLAVDYVSSFTTIA